MLCNFIIEATLWHGCSAANLMYRAKRLWHRCFSVNFAKFLRTSFLQNTSGRLLWDLEQAIWINDLLSLGWLAFLIQSWFLWFIFNNLAILIYKIPFKWKLFYFRETRFFVKQFETMMSSKSVIVEYFADILPTFST